MNVAEAERALVCLLEDESGDLINRWYSPNKTCWFEAADLLAAAHRYAVLRALAAHDAALQGLFCSAGTMAEPCAHYGGARPCQKARREALEKEAADA